jgi:microcompartment protein CcmK/EutM
VKFSTFIELFVAALYNETQLERRPEFRVGEILDRYNLVLEPHWAKNFFSDHTLSSLVDTRRHLGPLRQQYVSLSSEGVRWVEEELGDNVASFLEQLGAIHNSHGEKVDERQAIDGSSWTGLPSEFRLTDQKRESLITMLQGAELALDSLGAGNSEKAMARAYIVAARTLADAPDPPVDIIWEILNRANSLAGIASLFVSIIALFTAAA